MLLDWDNVIQRTRVEQARGAIKSASLWRSVSLSPQAGPEIRKFALCRMRASAIYARKMLGR